MQTKTQIGTGVVGIGCSGIDHSQRQKRFTQQRSILKNSTERSSNQDEQELLEAKKQLILRRRRLFSHYRQYEQWRRRQFSYDPCYYRATPLPIGQMANNNNNSNNNSMGYVSIAQGQDAFRRRRQYRRQYSCAEREDSRESRESSSLQRYKGESMMASDSFNIGGGANFNYNSIEQQQQQRSQWLQQYQQKHQHQHQHRHEKSMLQQQTIECYSPMGRRSHFHMMHEERSASISERCTRSRINSAIFVSSEGRGFDSIEFLRRHGSQSVLCRKARSAENITDNGRKKSFSENKRSWHLDENNDSDLNATNKRLDDFDGSAIELRECRPNSNNVCSNVCGSESRTLSVLTANINCDHPSTSAAAAAAAAASMSMTNMVVGSISLEAPPAHFKDELHNSNSSIDVNATTATVVTMPNGEKRSRPKNFAGISSKSSTSHESVNTVEELVPAPTVAVATAAVVPEIIAAVTRPRTLMRQRSSTVTISPHPSPKSLTLKNAPRTKIAALPMVSVSGPSPPHEKSLPQPTTTEYL